MTEEYAHMCAVKAFARNYFYMGGSATTGELKIINENHIRI